MIAESDFSRESAREFCNSKNWQGLLKYASDWNNYDPRNAVSVYYQAIAFRELMMPDKAEALYKDAISLDPTFTEAWFNLGIIANDQERFDEAEVFFLSGLKCEPENLKFILDVARFYAHRDKFSDASEYYRQAQEIKPFCKSFYGEYCQTLLLADLKEEYYDHIEMLKIINYEQYEGIKKMSFPSVGYTKRIISTLYFKHFECNKCGKIYHQRNKPKHVFYYQESAFNQLSKKLELRTNYRWCNECGTQTLCEDLTVLCNVKKLGGEIVARQSRIDSLKRQKNRSIFSRIFDKSYDFEKITNELNNQETTLNYLREYLYAEKYIQKVSKKRKPICLICNGNDLDNTIIFDNTQISSAMTNKNCGSCFEGKLSRSSEWSINTYDPNIFITPGHYEYTEKFCGVSDDGKMGPINEVIRSSYGHNISGAPPELIRSFMHLYNSTDRNTEWHYPERILAFELNKNLFTQTRH